MAATNILKALKFYKKEGFAQLNDSYFPSEFYATGYLINHGVDKQGGPLIGFCNRCFNSYRDISDDMYELGRRYMLYNVYKTRIELDPKPRTTYVAAEGAAYNNFDIKMLTNIVDFVNDFMPNTPGRLIVADMSPLMIMTFKVLVNLLKDSFQQMLTFTTMSEIRKWIDYQQIPAYMGGNVQDFKRIPDGVKSGKCLHHLKYIPDSDWQAFIDHNIMCIREGMKELGFKSQEKYLRVRQMVIDHVGMHPDLYDEMDIEHIRNKDYIIEREGLAQLNDQYFPAEMYATGFLIRYGTDKKGAQLMGFCNRCYVPLADISRDMWDLGRKFLLYFVYKSRIELDNKPRAVYVSSEGTIAANFEISIMRPAIDFANEFMPSTPGNLLVLDLPAILRVTFRMIVSLLNEWFSGSVIFTTMREVKQWISYSEIPEYIGGNYNNYSRIPEGVKSGKCLKHLSYIPDSDWDMFSDNNIVCIREGMKEAGIKSLDRYLRISC
ncbi:unnamed protein product [Medioppia subpectinata]|uniref:CRAL-TRIO domain-containing protein n=1 Tax=Medioppia subpectinata TaxID=1979941 RepID=A0A7R9PWK1_9ACAR|nr:unnamed protein product [Medioppia subpectinata]CAG2102984.1 unnamed protein product [Medioppia subpectinata]